MRGLSTSHCADCSTPSSALRMNVSINLFVSTSLMMMKSRENGKNETKDMSKQEEMNIRFSHFIEFRLFDWSQLKRSVWSI